MYQIDTRKLQSKIVECGTTQEAVAALWALTEVLSDAV